MISISRHQEKRFGLRTGDTVEGEIRAPKDGERYFALLKLNQSILKILKKVRHRINFDNLTLLYPNESFSTFELPYNPDKKDNTPRVIDFGLTNG